MQKDAEQTPLFNHIYLAKAVGWYLDFVRSHPGHQKYTRISIAQQLHFSPSLFPRKIIRPQEAELIVDDISFKSKGKRNLTPDQAQEICTCLNTSLTDVLFFYEHKDQCEKDPSFFDTIRTLTSDLTSSPDPDMVQSSSFPDLNTSSFQETATSTSNFLSDATLPDFKPWLGKFYCYFSSTSSKEAGKKRRNAFQHCKR